MIFQHTWQKVLDGTKTQTRRPYKGAGHFGGFSDGRGGLYGITVVHDLTEQRWQGHRVRWMVGREYAVQPGRGQKAIARIELTGIRVESPRSISDVDARAEGFDTPDAWRETYARINGKAALDKPCWVLEFRLVEGSQA